ncbi:MAG: DMT family transporter [Anaerolineaceae bacterium]|jgi:drug/metabolite transporter (DMT)-like permease
MKGSNNTRMQTSSETKGSRNRGYTFAFLATLCFSTTAIFMRHLLSNYQLPPMVTAFWRDMLAAIALVIPLLLFKPNLLKVDRNNLFYLIGYGLVFALFNIIWTFAMVYNNSSVATVLLFSSAPFTAILGWWLLHETLGLPKIIAILLAMVGCTLVSLTGADVTFHWTGFLIGIGAGLFYAFYSLLGSMAAKRNLNPWTTTFYILLFASFFLLIFNLLPISFLTGQARSLAGLFVMGRNLSGWFWMSMLSIVSTIGGFGFYNNSLVYLPSSVAKMFLTSVPVLTSILAYLFFREILSPIQILGGLLVVGGLVLLRVSEDWHRRSEQKNKNSATHPE